MASSGPNSAGTGVDDTTVGTFGWSTPTNIYTSNDISANAIFGTGVAGTTHYLKATNFGFAISGGDTIDGIVVEIERKCTHSVLFEYAQDNIVKIVKGGTISGTDKADTVTKWPTTDAYASYGGAADLWGLSWTASDINDSTFGVVISANINLLKLPVVARIDHIRITVYYTAGTAGGGGGGSVSKLGLLGVG
jgi:hypothetical protein